MYKINRNRFKQYKNYLLEKFQKHRINIILLLGIFFLFQILSTVAYINLIINWYMFAIIFFIFMFYLFRFRVYQLVYLSLLLISTAVTVTILGGETAFTEKIGNLVYVLFLLCLLMSLPLLRDK